FDARELPLVHTEAGIDYVPVEAWCRVLGVRLGTHLWRLRHKLFWKTARQLELACSWAGEEAAEVDPPAPSCCLRPDLFLTFPPAVGGKRLYRALHTALRAMGDAEGERAQAQAQERQEPYWSYEEPRRPPMDTLVVCERGERELAYVEEHVTPRL